MIFAGVMMIADTSSDAFAAINKRFANRRPGSLHLLRFCIPRMDADFDTLCKREVELPSTFARSINQYQRDH
jgi:hypothetical protein